MHYNHKPEQEWGTGDLKFLSQVALDELKFFTKPKLALDAVGGESAIKMADCLSEVTRLATQLHSMTLHFKCLAIEFIACSQLVFLLIRTSKVH